MRDSSGPWGKIDGPPRRQSSQADRAMILGDHSLALQCFHIDLIQMRHLRRPHAGIRHDRLGLRSFDRVGIAKREFGRQRAAVLAIRPAERAASTRRRSSSHDSAHTPALPRRSRRPQRISISDSISFYAMIAKPQRHDDHRRMNRFASVVLRRLGVRLIVIHRPCAKRRIAGEFAGQNSPRDRFRARRHFFRRAGRRRRGRLRPRRPGPGR